MRTNNIFKFTVFSLQLPLIPLVRSGKPKSLRKAPKERTPRRVVTAQQKLLLGKNDILSPLIHFQKK